MIVKKEFYFLRHGQTEYNALDIQDDHPAHIPLNDIGRQQAKEVEPIIASLPIKKVCCSPMNRAQETKQIVLSRLEIPSEDIHDLSECTALEWFDMEALGFSHHSLAKDPARQFFERVRRGINQALSHDETVLIVAHCGIHWALCSLMEIQGHDWMTDNCVPIHFFVGESGEWRARKLITHR